MIMRIAVLQPTFGGFFPRYYNALHEAFISQGHFVKVFGTRNSINNHIVLPNQVLFGSRLNWHIHHFLFKITGVHEIFSLSDTLHLLFKLSKFKPDVIHLNMINKCVLNMPLFVKYVNYHKIPVVWTMHDCRAFTAFCPYPDEENCEKWKTGCHTCPVCYTRIDNSNLQWKINRKWNSGFDNLTIVTPSKWLAYSVKESFFKYFPLKVIYNGVNTDVFSQKSECDIRQKYSINVDKKIVLGCAINWEVRKGLIFFDSLADLLPENYQIVLIGGIKDEQKKDLSRRIICTGRTSTFDEMIAWYQNASVFCNPTLADNFPTTNIEALAAGTPVVTFRTGGSPEAIDEKTGIVVEQGNMEALGDAILQVCENRDYYTVENCRIRSMMFSQSQYNEYIKLFSSLI